MVGALLAVMLASAADQPIGPGVSESIARERAEHFRNVRYELVFTIPADRRTPVEGRIVVRVSLAAPHRIALDFEQPRDHVQSVPTLLSGVLYLVCCQTLRLALEPKASTVSI